MKFNKIETPTTESKAKKTNYNIDKDSEFWRFTHDKETGKTITGCKFNYMGFKKFAKLNDLYKKPQTIKEKGSKCNHVLVRKNGNILAEITHDDLNDFVMKVASKINEYWVAEMIMRSGSTYLSEKTTRNFDIIKPTLQKSGKDFAYLFFKNEAWKITPDKIIPVSYDSLENMIWEEQIIDKSPKLMKELFTEKKTKEGKEFDVHFCKDAAKMDFLQYLYKTSNVFHQKDKLSKEEQTEVNTNFMNKMTAFGYLLHQHKRSSKAMAVIGMDLQNVEVGDAKGGTGKSIFGQAVRKIIPSIYVNGKRINKDDKFTFGGVTEKTNFVFIDDVRISYDFENNWAEITGDFQVNKKGVQTFTLSPDQVIKIYISTNYILRGNRDSDLRRQFQIGFSDYYNPSRSPADDFGHDLFDDWDDQQWEYFYNLCARAIQMWLKHGKVEMPGESITIRRLRQNMGEEFLKWALSYYDPTSKLFNQLDKSIERKQIFEDFLKTISMKKRSSFSAIRFGKCMKDFCQYKGYVFDSKKTNGVEFWTIYTKKIPF